MAESEKMNLKSKDVAEEKRERLKELFPEAFEEDKVNFDQLKRALGEWIDPGRERFGLSWPGKADCMKIIQQPSVATLKPSRDESVNFDDTENLFIEGDNLQVLKLLQKAYFSKIKMIYIDPPYNTGKEFIYPDNYSETLEAYLAYTGQIDDDGRRYSTNTDSVGRYHSNWLNMMYPRLYLAKNLLRDDGVIFINIDDNEMHNLREICDQIFGEENFVGVFPWRSRTAKADVPHGVSKDIEWIVCYCKPDFVAGRAGERKYHKSDDYEDRWRLSDITTNKTKDERPNAYFTMVNPKNGTEYPANATRTWSVTKDTFPDYYDKGKIVFPGDYHFLKIKRPAFRVFESEDKQNALDKYGTEEVKMSVSTYLPKQEVGRTEHGSKEIRELFGAQVFPYPKPTSLIKFLIKNISDPDAIVMDFFAGSGTTADAVIQTNAEDGGNRRFILVQFPEPLRSNSIEQKTAAEYCKTNDIKLNISALSQERIRRASKRISQEQDGQFDLSSGGGQIDVGFKVFELAPSNFRIWEGDISKVDDLGQQLLDHIDHISDSSTQEDILYELLLKSGLPLTTTVETVRLAGKDVFSVAQGTLLICLDKELNQAVIDAMAEAGPLQVICLDKGFKGNDQLKANAMQTFKARAQNSKDHQIVFKTV